MSVEADDGLQMTDDGVLIEGDGGIQKTVGSMRVCPVQIIRELEEKLHNIL